MPEDINKPGRGGARKGAGRPRTYSKLMAFRVQKDVAAYIEQHPNKSKFIQKCVMQEMAADRNAFANEVGTFTPASKVKTIDLPMVDLDIAAGYPIPLDNQENTVETDILSKLCPHPETNYMINVKGDSMIDANIFSGDILIVDRSNHNPTEKEIAICELNGEYTVKRVKRIGKGGYLIPANPNYHPIEIKENDDFSVWGVVMYIIHKAK